MKQLQGLTRAMEATKTKVIQTYTTRNDDERDFERMLKTGHFPKSVLTDATLEIPHHMLNGTVHEKIFPKTYDTEEVTAILDPNSGTATMLIFTDGSYADSDKSDKLGKSKHATSSVAFRKNSDINRVMRSRGTPGSFTAGQEALVDALLHIPEEIHSKTLNRS